MLFTIQFPIADARLLLTKGNRYLPLIESGKEPFLRHFGSVERRMSIPTDPAGELDWVRDVKYVYANAALTVPDLGKYYQGHQRNTPKAPPAFLLKAAYLSRHLFVEDYVARVEIKFKAKSPFRLGKSGCVSVIEDFLMLPTQVPIVGGSGYLNNKLIRQGSNLTKLFLHATTASCINDSEVHKQALIPCNPLLLIEYDEDVTSLSGTKLYESILPNGATVIDKQITNGVSLAHYIFRVAGRGIQVWFIGKNKENKHNAWLLRLCLLKLFAYQETFKNILFFINNSLASGKKDDIQIDMLERYLSSSSVTTLLKKRNYGVDQSAIVEIVTRCISSANNADLIDIEKQLDTVETRLSTIIKEKNLKQLSQLIHDALKDVINIINTTNYGYVERDMVVGNVTYTTNKGASEPTELGKKLGELKHEIENLCKDVHDSDRVYLNDLLNILLKTVSAKEPNKTILKANGKSLTDHVNTIAETTKSLAGTASAVVAAVGAVLAFFS